MDLENMDRDQTSFFQVVDQSMYSKNWEKEVIMKIARKLATLPCDIELMFGIFTQGSRNVTKVNFKHTVLHRLNLIKQGMTERELDLIFTSNEYLRKSDIIERDDFVEIFGPSILQAKRERQTNNTLLWTARTDPCRAKIFLFPDKHCERTIDLVEDICSNMPKSGIN